MADHGTLNTKAAGSITQDLAPSPPPSSPLPSVESVNIQVPPPAITNWGAERSAQPADGVNAALGPAFNTRGRSNEVLTAVPLSQYGLV